MKVFRILCAGLLQDFSIRYFPIMATVQTPPKQRTSRILANKAPATKEETSAHGQDRWNELLATPESDALLMLLVEDAKRNEAEGKYDEEDWEMRLR